MGVRALSSPPSKKRYRKYAEGTLTPVLRQVGADYLMVMLIRGLTFMPEVVRAYGNGGSANGIAEFINPGSIGFYTQNAINNVATVLYPNPKPNENTDWQIQNGADLVVFWHTVSPGAFPACAWRAYGN